MSEIIGKDSEREVRMRKDMRERERMSVRMSENAMREREKKSKISVKNRFFLIKKK